MDNIYKININVDTLYIEPQSDPENNRYVFIGRHPKKFVLNFLGIMDEKTMDHESMSDIKDVGLD